MAHVETLVKINAWVDRSIAPLVSALNSFDRQIVTVDSCEGRGRDAAYVYFVSHNGKRSLFAIVDRLSKILRRELKDNDFRLQMEWVAGSEEPMATLLMSRELITDITEALNGAVASCVRTTASRDGTLHTGLHNSTNNQSRRRSRRGRDETGLHAE